MSWIAGLLTRRLGVADTAKSLARIAGWVVVWALVLGHVISPHKPVYTDRPTPPDNPPSAARYVAPLDKTDLAGFLPPPHDPDSFTVAWVGGSDVKLREVSLAGEFSRRLESVGGKPLKVDVYNLLAARSLDAYLSVQAAIESGADALVVSLNPVWSRGEWSVHDWPSLDVSNLDDLAGQRRLWPWLPSIVSPSDLSWAALDRLLPLVEAKANANQRAAQQVDKLDIVADPPQPLPEPTPNPELPLGATDFFLVQYFGTAVMDSSLRRMEALLTGFGLDDAGLTDQILNLIIDAAVESGKPVYLYLNPFSFEALDDPSFGPVIERVEHELSSLAAGITTPTVELNPISLSRRMERGQLFFDIVHMNDAGPAAELMVGDLCTFWQGVDDRLQCILKEGESG